VDGLRKQFNDAMLLACNMVHDGIV